MVEKKSKTVKKAPVKKTVVKKAPVKKVAAKRPAKATIANNKSKIAPYKSKKGEKYMILTKLASHF